jgi:hypothetical protein
VFAVDAALDESLEVGMGDGADPILDPVRRLSRAGVVALDERHDHLAGLDLEVARYSSSNAVHVIGELIRGDAARNREEEEAHANALHRRGKRFVRQARAWISTAIGSPLGVLR